MKLGSQKFGTMSFPTDYDVIRTVTLNKTDLAGGNNKYYQIEAHVSKDKKKFRLYSRYGRVGADGQQEERIPDQNEEALLSAFDSLKAEKTGKSKGYVEVKMAATKIGSSVNNAQILSDDVKKEKLAKDDKDKDGKKTKINLHPSVEKLIDRLYTEAGQAVRQQLSGSLNTTVENPLGTLTLTQIQHGRSILQEIQQMIVDKPKMKGTIHADLIKKSNEFFSAIPQKIAHRPKPSEGKKALDEWLATMVLNDEKRLDDKEELLELLSDVQGMVKGFASTDLEKKYVEIGCEYVHLGKDEESYKKIEKFHQSTRSDRHDWKAEIKNIWRVVIKGQKDKHLPTMKEVGNIKPLFHGSGPQNILGICKRGLLMRPPGVYITGSMFGNGLYFADQSSKSEQYSFGRYGGGSGKGETYFMFVTDVALGKIKEYEDAQTHLTEPPRGFHSVQGKKGRWLVHNEFIVYDIKQHILQYLIEFKTNNRW